MISLGFMYSFGQLPGFFLWSSQLWNNLLLTRHVAETHSEGVTNLPVFLTNFLLELRGDFHFSILDYWVIYQDAIVEIFFQVESEIQSNNLKSFKRIPWKCFNTCFFSHPPTDAKKIPQLFTMFFDSCHHKKSTCSPEANSGTAASPLHGTWRDPTKRPREPWGVNGEIPRTVSIQLDVKSQNGKCTVHVRHVLFEKDAFTISEPPCERDAIEVESKKGKQCWWDEVVHKSVQLPSCYPLMW